MKEVYFFYKKRIDGKTEESVHYDSLELAMQARRAALEDPSFKEIGPVTNRKQFLRNTMWKFYYTTWQNRRARYRRCYYGF